MKKEIDLKSWNRKDHYQFFSQFEEPFFGVTLQIDCSNAYQYAKENDFPFFLYYLYGALKAANETEAFRYRILDKKVFLFDKIHASSTISRPDQTFGFAHLDYHEDANRFYESAKPVIEEVRQSSGLTPAVSGENVIHFSAIPWLNFTALSHARCYAFADSIPKISFGQLKEENGVKTMPISIHGHHGLIDGYHMGLFAAKFQEFMNFPGT
jgi:chloramphenicol O-acetyltransferase type A